MLAVARGFPAEFTWGVATSAYQIEGAREERGESIWDRFAHTPGSIIDGSTGDVACDHYHRVGEDVDLMSSLGVSAYRFSVAWTRVLPDGTGRVDAAGLGFYDALVDQLLDAGITPWVTLYHWDLPQRLEDAGGWPNRATVGAFLEYTDLVTSRLGDRVKNWITINEPWVAAFLGYRDGIHAPGRRDWSDALAAAHHLLLAHGRAVPVIRASVAEASVGIALDCRPSSPATDRLEDARAQRHFDGFRNRWFFDPVFGRGYPDDMVKAYRARGRFSGERPPFVREGDLAEIAAPIDFLGLNYYTSVDVAAGSEEADDPERAPGADQPEGFTEMGWRNTPGALRRYLSYLHREYAPPRIVVTENGAGYGDGPEETDERRIEYLETHVDAVGRAIDAGVPVDGYFVWSLMDNFEWGLGYTQRFGLVWVDSETLERVPKRSFTWYRDQIVRSQAGGAT
jgi:beta-glucosidase